MVGRSRSRTSSSRRSSWRNRFRRRNRERPVVRSQGTPSAPDEGALTVVFYLDDPNIFPSHRTRLLRRLEAAVEPWRSMGASFMLARFLNRLEVLVPPTPDLDVVLEGAASIPKAPPRAIQNGEGARRFAIRSIVDSYESCAMAGFCRPCVDNWGEMLSLARQYADNQATNGAIAVDGLADLVTTLSGVPGRKAVVYVTDGLPQRPGISVLDYLGNELCTRPEPQGALGDDGGDGAVRREQPLQPDLRPRQREPRHVLRRRRGRRAQCKPGHFAQQPQSRPFLPQRQPPVDERAERTPPAGAGDGRQGPDQHERSVDPPRRHDRPARGLVLPRLHPGGTQGGRGAPDLRAARLRRRQGPPGRVSTNLPRQAAGRATRRAPPLGGLPRQPGEPARSRRRPRRHEAPGEEESTS